MYNQHRFKILFKTSNPYFEISLRKKISNALLKDLLSDVSLISGTFYDISLAKVRERWFSPKLF